MPTKPPVEQAKFWRDPGSNNLELLRATYVTYAFSRHVHEGYAIAVIESGIEEFIHQGSTHRATVGDIAIINPAEVHTGHAGIPSGWTYRVFYPEVSLLQKAASEIRDGAKAVPYFPTPVIHDKQLAAQLRRLHIAMEISESRLEQESCFLWTFAKLVARYADSRPWTAPIGQENLSVRRVLDYLNTHYAEAISLEQLASIATLKPLRLLRVFQRQVGLPPHAYLVQLRVARAKAALAGGVPIAQVAFETGFTDQSHLNRHFKRMVGVTPGQYAVGCCKNVQDEPVWAV